MTGFILKTFQPYVHVSNCDQSVVMDEYACTATKDSQGCAAHHMLRTCHSTGSIATWWKLGTPRHCLVLLGDLQVGAVQRP